MHKQSFNQNWQFHLGDFDGARWGTPAAKNWQTVDLPHDWSITLNRASHHESGVAGGFFPMGRGWYQKQFSTPTQWQGKSVWVEFEGIYMNAEIWLNQNLLGRHPYGYTTFQYELTPYLAWDKPNLLKILVDNAHQLNSRWYSGSGIYRPAWLITAEAVHIAHWGVYITTPQVTSETALVQIQTRVKNSLPTSQNITLQTRILDPNGSEAGKCVSIIEVSSNSQHEFQQNIQVSQPMLWSPQTPFLYRLVSEVMIGNQLQDTEERTFGIRSLDFSAEKGFLLNGTPLLLKGGCVHHDNGILGAASYLRSEERKVEIHKANGYNAIRCAHNPPAPSFLDACDWLGMLVIDEAFDCWREGKNHGDYHVVFEDWWQRDLDSMIYRDRNHPSIILWSIGNEVLERDGRGNGIDISRKLAERVRSIDPSRPVTAAICGSWDGGDWQDMDPAFATLDVGGYNYQWAQYKLDHQRLPDRIMVGTESFPLEAFENWLSVIEEPYIIGDFVWTSLDYLGESGIGRVHFEGEKAPFLGGYPWHQANCGDLDLCGFKRPQSYYRDTLWRDDPCLYIAVHSPIPEGKTATISRWGWPEVWSNWNWPGQEGQIYQVDLYTNCDQVALFLNRQPLGNKPCGKEQKFMATFEVPYQPGELFAIGYRAGQPVIQTSLHTAAPPCRIRLTPDRETIPADHDLCYVAVEILDEHGRLHPKANNLLFFTITGPAEILAVGSSNPVSEESYTGNQRRAHRGRALVVIKSTEEPGEIRLRAQADGLEVAEICIQSNPK